MSFTLPWRNVTRHKIRTYLIIAAITISVGLETGIAITIDSIHEDFIENQRGNNYTDITIHPNSNSTLEDIKTVVESVTNIAGVKKASPVATFLIDRNASGLGDISDKKEKIVLYGLDPDSHTDYPYSNIPEESYALDPPSVIVSWSIFKETEGINGNLTIPENNSLGFNGLNATIMGTISDGSTLGNYVGYFFILIHIDHFADLFAENYVDFQIVVQVKELIKVNKVAERIQDSVGLNFDVIREKSIRQSDVLAVEAFQAGMALIIIASIIVEFLFITNILTLNIKDRSKEFGSLRAIGSSNFQITTFLSIEFLIYAGIASILGVLFGVVFSHLSVFILDFNFPRLSIDTPTFKTTTITFSFFLGIIITFISGLYPMLRAISLPVIQTLHWAIQRKKGKRRYWPILLITGCLLTGFGIIIGNSVESEGFLEINFFSLHFISVGMILLGVVFIETGLIHFLPTFGRKLLFWYRQMPKTIATRNIERESQKSTITVLVSAIALSIILIMGITTTALIEYVPLYYSDKFGRIEVVVETSDGSSISTSFINELTSDNVGVDIAAYIQQQRTVISNTEGYVFGVDPYSFNYFINETIINSPEQNISKLLNSSEKGAIISDKLLSRIGARIGDNLSIQLTTNSFIDVTLKGITQANPILQEGEYLFISNTSFQSFWPTEAVKWLVVKTSSTLDAQTVTIQLRGKYQDSFREVIPVEGIEDTIRTSLQTTSLFFQLLVLYTFLLSALAQFLSTLMSVLRMQRELAIMRSLGLSQNAVLSIFSTESILIGTTGIIIGVINGLIGAELIAWYINFSIPIQVTFQAEFILIWAFISLLITVTTSEITTRRTMNTIIADALSGESLFNIKTKKSLYREWGTYLESRDKRESILDKISLDPKDKKKG